MPGGDVAMTIVLETARNGFVIRLQGPFNEVEGLAIAGDPALAIRYAAEFAAKALGYDEVDVQVALPGEE